MSARSRRLALAVTASMVVGTCLVTIGPAGTAQAVSHHVLIVPRDFPTIQSAVDAAVPGDTINIGPGTFHEQVVINKDVVVHGSGASSTVIEAPATLAPYGVNTQTGTPLAAVVRIGRHAKVQLSGLGVSGTVPCTSVDEGIGVVEDADLDVSDVRVSDMVGAGCDAEAYGMVFGVSPKYAINGVPGGTTATGRVSRSVVDTYQSAGIVVVGPYGRTPSHVTVTDNTVSAGAPVDPASQVGIWIRLNAVGQVTGNTISGGVCSYDGCGFDPIEQYQSIGAVVEASSGTTVAGNHMSGADVGLFVNADDVTVTGNSLVDNNYFGIVVFDAAGITRNNTISGGRVGIGVVAASRDATELSRGDHIGGVSGSATQLIECCGFHASVTVKP